MSGVWRVRFSPQGLGWAGVASLSLGLISVDDAVAAGKKVQSELALKDGKKVIEIAKPPLAEMEMPDQSLYSFGPEFQASLVNQLVQTGRYVVLDESPLTVSGEAGRPRLLDRRKASSGVNAQDQAVILRKHYVWRGTTTPAVRLRVEVLALSMRAGIRGEQVFYGFDQSFKTPFQFEVKNEFPSQEPGQSPTWFGKSFRNNSATGGNRWKVTYTPYRSELKLRLHLSYPNISSNQPEKEEFHDRVVHGQGFFFDAQASSGLNRIEVVASKKDFMLQLVRKSLAGALADVESLFERVPLRARVDRVLPDGLILLGTGSYSEVRKGVLYRSLADPSLVVQVLSSGASGSEAQVVAGDRTQLNSGMLLQQVDSVYAVEKSLVALPPAAPASVRVVNLTAEVHSKSLKPGVHEWLRAMKDQFWGKDQSYHRYPDLPSLLTFGLHESQPDWVKQIGLDQAPPMKDGLPGGLPVVAIIDTGIDYNHPQLHGSLWLNPSPSGASKSHMDHYGWDFIAHDSRPYDDHHHGTALASLVARVAPRARIMPLKAFHSDEFTTSASLYASFIYAVDHGAQVILCGWSTWLASRALRLGVEYAKAHGVIVVAAAGDEGQSLAHLASFPAGFSDDLDHVLVVTAVDAQDRRLNRSGGAANFGSRQVHLAAPGQDLVVAHPRGAFAKATSTGLSAAIVAGALARVVADQEGRGTYRDWIALLLEGSDSLPGLQDQVMNGRRLRVRR